MKREVTNQVNLWNSRCKDHIEKQLHNPFSEWSNGNPKKLPTSPIGEYSNLPIIYSSRSPSPFEEAPSFFNPQKFNPLGGQSPKPFYSQTFSPVSEQFPKPFYPKPFHPSGEQSPRISNLNPTNLSKGQDPNTFDSQNSSEPDDQVNFLSQVRKWRKPGTEIKNLVPLTKIPEQRKAPKAIKSKVPIPAVWEDPLKQQNPQDLSLLGKSEQKSFSPQAFQKTEFLNRSVLPEEEHFKFNLTKPFTPDDTSKSPQGWTPMGKTFANLIGGKQTISEDSYKESRQQDTRFDNNYPNPVSNWNQPVNTTQFYTNQLQESESSDMNFRRLNMSSQINQWQQRAIEHEQKQLLNPFSEWDGASHCPKLSKTDADYGKPIEGSMTEIRGKKAGEHIGNEIVELCQVISDLGDLQPDNTIIIKFGTLFQAYTRISNKLVGMLMRARKQNLVHFEGEMLFQGRDDDVEIKLLKTVEQQTAESVAGIESESGDEARFSGGVPAKIKISASGKEASATQASSEEMMSKSESANSTSMLMKKGSSISSSSMMNEESSMSMKEESLGSSKMMASSSSSTQMMSKENDEFSTKMLAGSSNISNMMSKEESSNSTKMFSESSSSMKMLKEEGSHSTQMLGEAVGDSTKMLAGVSISPAVTEEALMDSLKSGDIFNSMKMVPREGNTSQILQNELGTLSNMASSEMVSTQQASSSSSTSSMMTSKEMSTTSEQMSTSSEQMTTAMENISMSNEQKKMSSQMSTASEQMSMASEQMSMASEQMSTSNKQMSMASEQMSTSNKQMSMASEQMSSSSQMKQVSDFSQMSTSERMSSLLDDTFGKMVSAQGTTTSGSIQKSSQQSSSSQVLSKTLSSFESSSNTALMDETHSLMSSEIQDLKQLT